MAEKIRRPREEFIPVVQSIHEAFGYFDWWHEIGGSWRRQRHMIADLDVVIFIEPDEDFAGKLQLIIKASKGSWEFDVGGDKAARGTILGKRVDLWRCPPESYGPFMWFITGPADLNVAMRASAKSRGWEFPQYSLRDGDGNNLHRAPTSMDDLWKVEMEIAQKLDWPWMPPSHRDEWEEILADQANALETVEVPSSSGTSTYTLTHQADGTWTCTCKGFSYRRKCRHVSERNNT